MASYHSQGAKIQRISTIAGSSASVTAATIAFSSAAKTITRSDVGDFTVDGFTTAMILYTDSTANSTRVMRPVSVAATVITVNEAIIDQSTGTSLTVTGNVFADIGQVTNITGPAPSVGIIDITHLGSTAKEKTVATYDAGQVTFDFIADLTTTTTSLHEPIRDDLAARTERTYAIVLTDQSTGATAKPTAFYFDGYVTGWSITEALDDVIKGSITLELTSAVRELART